MARIAILVDDLEAGGSERFLRDLALSLKVDQEVRVVGLFAGGPVADRLVSDGMSVSVLGLTKGTAPWKFFDLISFLTDEGIEVLHCERLASAIIGVPAGRLAGVSRVFVRRENLPWWPNETLRRLDRLAMRWADGIIVPSQAIRKGFVEAQGLPADRFRVIPHGLADPIRPPPVPSSEGDASSWQPIVGCIANFDRSQDHETLFDAFRSVAEEIPEAQLVLVGTGPREPELREQVGASSVRDRVEFLGPRAELSDLLERFDVLVLPAVGEGFGRILLEAMGAGVPVVATAVGGIPEVVSNDLTGILVKPKSPGAMSGAILHVLREPDERRRLVRNALLDVADRFSLESVVSRYRDVIGVGPPSEEVPPVLEDTPCPLCRGKNGAPITRRPDGMRIVHCAGCGLLFMNPRPTKDGLASLYTAEYFEGEGEFGWMKGYLETEIAQLDLPQSYFGALLRRFEGHLGRRGILLDVGCSGGFFLEQAKRAGWEGHGVEVSEAMVKFARDRFGHERIFHGTLEDARYPDAKFDAVLLHNVIEHVADPVGTMKEVGRILKPGGVTCLTTPNARAVAIQGGLWRGFHAHFGHVTFFTRSTLDRLLVEAGLDAAEWEYQNQNLTFAATRGLKMMMDSRGAPAGVRRILSRLRVIWRSANGALFRFVNGLGFSRNLLVFARRGSGSGTDSIR